MKFILSLTSLLLVSNFLFAQQPGGTGAVPSTALVPVPAFTPTPRPIQGVWLDAASGITVEFKRNGAVIETRPDGNTSEGNYAILDDTHVRIQPASQFMPGGAYLATFTVIGNQLQFTTLDGHLLRSLTRVAPQVSQP